MSAANGKNVALSVEGLTVRMVTFSGKKVVSWYEVPMGASWVKGGLVTRPEEVGKAVARTMEEHKVPRRGVVSALGSNGSGAQVLNLPGVKKSKLGEAVRRELKRLSPGSTVDNDYVYTQALPKKSSVQEVYTLTVPKKNVLNLVEAFQGAGMSIRAIELSPFALARAANCRDGIVVHAEADAIEVVVVSEGFPVNFRSIAVQGGADDPYAAVQQLLSELPRTIDYYNRSHADTPLADETPVYLCGGLALDPEVAMGVADVTGREVANIEPAVDCPPDFPLVQYMTHVGLILAG